MSTRYHARYFAHELTLRCSSHQLEKLNQSLLNATVDLNPHQVDAALFAFRSPLSRGAILADEVGLGKTIEAGLIISQLWAERRRRILCILPAALRPQWRGELSDKFFIGSVILESHEFNRLRDAGAPNPFEQPNAVVICSYNFARSQGPAVRAVPWDLVVVDEAHRLRNVYKKSSKIARSIYDAIADRPKVLLTATPLQNSLMELFGLVSFVDPHVFGNEKSFREQFARRASDVGDAEFAELKRRLHPVCRRTLRRQVTEFIRYTNRASITEDFTPTDQEARLYEAVSAYLQRPASYALPSSQRALMTLVLRKILASSSFAIAATLEKMVRRLEHMLAEPAQGDEQTAVDALAEDFELAGEIQEEWAGEAQETDEPGEPGGATEEQERRALHEAIRQEADELKSYGELAASILDNAKGNALLLALGRGFEKLAGLGAARKALIFTESKRTQSYLRELLEKNGYPGQVVTLNGTNAEPHVRPIYEQWRRRHEGEDIVSGRRSVDVRTALVEEFRDHASIMIATESGAEGINLQFCSLVVNYDLPWNPQRIEQRIGRCHRYGQKFDVVVINFLNRRNAADQRVFELLAEKLRLFDGIFGASDEILGALESGVDFEKRINDIYQCCRTPEEINAAFDRLQAELDEQIRASMEDARSKLLEHFDDDVRARLKDNQAQTAEQVSRHERWLWRLTAFELRDNATFDPKAWEFDLRRTPDGLSADEAPAGRYRLVRHPNGGGFHQYRLGHPLAERLVERAKSRSLPARELVFRYDAYDGKLSVVEQIRGQAGWLRVAFVVVESLEREEHMAFACVADDGRELDAEVCEKLLMVPGEEGREVAPPEGVASRLAGLLEAARSRIVAEGAERNGEYFSAEMDKLEAWADDLKRSLEEELKELDREIKGLKKEARAATDLDQKVALHRKAKEAERRRNEKRRSLFDAQDEVDRKKEELIGEIEERLRQKVEVSELFTVRWSVE